VLEALRGLAHLDRIRDQPERPDDVMGVLGPPGGDLVVEHDLLGLLDLEGGSFDVVRKIGLEEGLVLA